MINGNTEIIKSPVRRIDAEAELLYGGSANASQTGKYVIINDASPVPHALNIQGAVSGGEIIRTGKNLAKTKSVKSETFTGVKIEIQDDGTFIVNGTAEIDYTNAYMTNYLVSYHGNRNRYPAGTYTVKVRVLGGSSEGYIAMAVSNTTGTTYPVCYNGQAKVVLPEESELSVFCQFLRGQKAENYHISLQIDAGDVPTEYEPYMEERVPVSADGTAIISSQPKTMIYSTLGDVLTVGYKQSTGSEAPITFKNTDNINGITIERLGEEKFFGYGVSHKANLKIRDIQRTYNFSTSHYFNIYFNNVSVCPPMRITEVHRDENTNELSITTYDAMEQASAHYVNELGLVEYTIRDFAAACASLIGAAGIEADYPEFDLDFPEGANFEGSETIRDALNDVAEATQTIYYLNNKNILVFKRLDVNGAPVETITKEDYIKLNSKTNRRLVGICSATELGDNVEAKLDISGTIVYVRDNAFWALREDIGELVNNALANTEHLTVNQFDCSWRGNYLLEPGDKIGLVAKDDSIVYSYLINDTIKYDGTFGQETQWNYAEDEATAANPTSLGETLKQTFAKVDKANKQVDIVVSEMDATKSEMAALTLNTESISASVSGISTSMDEMSGQMEELTNKVDATMTDEEVKLEIQKTMDNGASKITTTTGFTFNETGLNISSTKSNISTTITENGMTVSDNGDAVLVANDEGVVATDLVARTFLVIGLNSRFEDYQGDRTACFWIGG